MPALAGRRPWGELQGGTPRRPTGGGGGMQTNVGGGTPYTTPSGTRIMLPPGVTALSNPIRSIGGFGNRPLLPAMGGWGGGGGGGGGGGYAPLAFGGRRRLGRSRR